MALGFAPHGVIVCNRLIDPVIESFTFTAKGKHCAALVVVGDVDP